MNTDKDLNCVDIVRAVIRIQELCLKGHCKNCIFLENDAGYFCALRYPFKWKTDRLNKWVKEHESEETK